MSGQELRQVEAALFHLASTLAHCKKLVDNLGGPKDTVDHRERLAKANSDVQALAKEIKVELKAIHDASIANGQVDVQQKSKKLLQDFAAILQDCKATQSIAAARESASLPRASKKNAFSTTAVALAVAGSHGVSRKQHSASQTVSLSLEEAELGTRRAADSSSNPDYLIEQQAIIQIQRKKEVSSLDNEVAFNAALIAERDAGIAEIHRQIGEVNEMFQDLAVLISDQGEQVQNLDEHIAATEENVREGQRQLVVADTTQRKTRNRWLWIWVIFALIVSGVILIVAS
uniref:t-SNARE coiled-coil homology domain-containing protein n=1 Tax=Polytomella parva TaxID=51329 RepID=A0A7S0UIU0_9CHLO|mmetsp:Transcript_10725/g.19595  ORF Transcript_10725/g.19595 Transcript_10725/m.19595 type:complete len:288 (+) Transcript_10725:126-989(+)|eukprot:CAMPEP_0175076868 /NCGR_PEP_ID=MMETSP0052_2-20121109/23014_1 /TAXON_ID=51329 ORGANISM="Polytomella parva, Strain SAG 63-3" /NCGR_SAMPLE_ID=MMETSP0052_2 /ASSEMBLY_ACC=CAM_ASM_000194 /LENGTH=287 /DNA_ID=CAMNT_0016346151 /DNA_START=101 /DNA_END=964 /DNA_ORIENTATION=+